MYGTQSKRDLALEFQSQIPILRPSIHTRRANLTVKFQDLYGFTVEGNVDDVNVLNEVREKVRQQGRVWWALEASKGANWYLQPSISEGQSLKASLKLSALANAITLKRLIRKGIPPVLRPKVWFSLSGAAKKKSTVPESYYNDLSKAVEGKVTPATRQIDHVSGVNCNDDCGSVGLVYWTFWLIIVDCRFDIHIGMPSLGLGSFWKISSLQHGFSTIDFICKMIAFSWGWFDDLSEYLGNLSLQHFVETDVR